MQLFMLGDDSKHKELTALSAVLAIETSTLSTLIKDKHCLGTHMTEFIFSSHFHRY